MNVFKYHCNTKQQSYGIKKPLIHKTPVLFLNVLHMLCIKVDEYMQG